MARPQQRIAEWLPDARAGSPRALGQVLEASRRYLLWVARREMDPDIQSKGGASDLVQQTFLEAQRDIGSFQGDTEADFLAWLRRLLLNNLLNFCRHYRETAKRCLDREVAISQTSPADAPPTDLAGPSASPCDTLIAEEQADLVRQALARLPEDYRQVLALWQEEQRTFQEIGQLMNRSPNATRMLWVRAIERLQEELDGEL